MPVLLFVVLALLVSVSPAADRRVAPRADLEPGDFTWHPETSPKGPVLVVVSLPQQRAYVYRNGVLIGRSTISSGREGKETPTGVAGTMVGIVGLTRSAVSPFLPLMTECYSNQHGFQMVRR